jgi:hypothetical protein
MPPLVIGRRVVAVTHSGTVVSMTGRTGHVQWTDARNTDIGLLGKGYELPPAPEAAHGFMAIPLFNKLAVYRSAS